LRARGKNMGSRVYSDLRNFFVVNITSSVVKYTTYCSFCQGPRSLLICQESVPQEKAISNVPPLVSTLKNNNVSLPFLSFQWKFTLLISNVLFFQQKDLGLMRPFSIRQFTAIAAPNLWFWSCGRSLSQRA